MILRENDKRDMVSPDQFEHHACLLNRPTLRHGDDDEVVRVDGLAVLVVRSLDPERKP